MSVQLTPNLRSLPRFPRLLNTIIPPLNTTEFQQRAASCHEPTSEPKEESQSGKRDLLHGKRDLLYDKREPPKEEGQNTHTHTVQRNWLVMAPVTDPVTDPVMSPSPQTDHVDGGGGQGTDAGETGFVIMEWGHSSCKRASIECVCVCVCVCACVRRSVRHKSPTVWQTTVSLSLSL